MLWLYAIVVEKTENNYSAYVPDLPGCVATGRTVEEVEKEIREAIEFHIAGLREDGMAVPQPSSIVEYLEVAAWPRLRHWTNPSLQSLWSRMVAGLSFVALQDLIPMHWWTPMHWRDPDALAPSSLPCNRYGDHSVCDRWSRL